MKLKFSIGTSVYLFIGLAILILWGLLLPGYILTLDMVFAPHMDVVQSATGFQNFLPLSYLIHFASMVIPAWLVQKIILFALFFCLLYLPYKFLPLKNNATAHYFSAVLYAVNPFVYARFLAGHWYHLIAYALLPVCIHFLFSFTKTPDIRSALKLCAIVFSISLFSLHFFAMTILILVAWFGYWGIVYLVKKDYVRLKIAGKYSLFGVFFLAIATSYWFIPALFRGQSLEEKFGSEHWQVFAATGHGGINTMLNVLSLNGFWGEGQQWSQQFLWPQDYTVFWVAFCLILSLFTFGVVYGAKNVQQRLVTVFFLILGTVAFVFSTGAGDTIFWPINLFLYEHVPYWSGFRDSTKFSGLLVLSYSVLSGLGVIAVTEFVKSKKPSYVIYVQQLLILIPVGFGLLAWGGFHRQIEPVWYPESWKQAQDVIATDAGGLKILILPWHGYISLNFNNNLLVANPARRYFRERAVVSRSVELGQIYDQEQPNTTYATLDEMVTSDLMRPDDVIDYLKQENIAYIVFFKDLENNDNLHYLFLSSDKLKRILSGDELDMYAIVNN